MKGSSGQHSEDLRQTVAANETLMAVSNQFLQNPNGLA